MEKNLGLLSSIKEKLLGKSAADTGKSTPAMQATSSIPGSVQAAIDTSKAAAAAQAATAKPDLVDVEAILEAAVKAKGIKLNWRESIVDLLKAIDLDSSLAARKELAKDLGYTGADPDGSAEKNIWLHKAVMKVLAESGGKIPKELLK
jgi:hypothetical protein